MNAVSCCTLISIGAEEDVRKYLLHTLQLYIPIYELAMRAQAQRLHRQIRTCIYQDFIQQQVGDEIDIVEKFISVTEIIPNVAQGMQ